MAKTLRFGALGITLAVALALPGTSHAQERNDTWGGVTTATAVASLATSVLMPRVFYSSPEATVGWRARWHVSVLAPTMTQFAFAMLNELALKEAFKEPRPGCEETGPGIENCETFALFSTQSYIAGGALGQGVATFLVDTIKYSGGRFNFGGFAGEVLLPLALTGVTVAGRSAGHFETFGQSIASAGVGLGTGLIVGLIYSTMQAPECGYSGNLICW
ncbi:MAG TPA: hypothetical protein VN764_10970 [Polyangiaceae bacterium]|nr:hypothetical protein [Polyangiaceae bacterium]